MDSKGISNCYVYQSFQYPINGFIMKSFSNSRTYVGEYTVYYLLASIIWKESHKIYPKEQNIKHQVKSNNKHRKRKKILQKPQNGSGEIIW